MKIEEIKEEIKQLLSEVNRQGLYTENMEELSKRVENIPLSSWDYWETVATIFEKIEEIKKIESKFCYKCKYFETYDSYCFCFKHKKETEENERACTDYKE